IKEAVWNCGGEKAPGLDWFTFKFIKCYWDTDPIHLNDFRPISLIGCQYKVIAKVLANRLLKVINSIVSEVQTAYIQGRQIIDGPLIVNEILAWATKKKECLFILKVDFEKAFDSLDWSFLDHVMCQMGFSSKWRTWIHGCLNSAYASVIVNGTPTKEFKIQKAYLKAYKWGHNNVDVSHLQFADDALIMGKWSLENAKNIRRILRCFHMSSELKVNFSKSKFFGIGVSDTDTNNFASFLNFQPSSLPCIYLGLPIGANMRGLYWKPIIDKFHNCLSSWKAKTLTLIKSVLGALGTYYFSLFKAPKYVIYYMEKLRRNFFWGGSTDSNMLAWIGWKKVCSSTNNGGLGIGSLQASNLAMLAKWRWRFHLDLDEHALWKRVIKSTYGIGGGLDISSTSYTLQPSPWKLFSLESTRDCKIMDRCYLDNESTDLKWDWRRPIRDGPERVQFDGLNNLLLHFVPSSSPDSWEFGLNESRCFTVSA
nr:putative RNA-directed DNA polymerase, eukaryota, reverse transcriptase zinc-binding domain protein [Tanacetum cinerariifolium]